jgi:hypothetical protein
MYFKGLVYILTLVGGVAFAQSGPTTQTKSGKYVSAGPGQYSLSVGTNTTLTVPSGTTCAYITVGGSTSSIFRTSDGSSSASQGTLIATGVQWADCGPLTLYRFSAAAGSPTLTVEYFK